MLKTINDALSFSKQSFRGVMYLPINFMVILHLFTLPPDTSFKYRTSTGYQLYEKFTPNLHDPSLKVV